MSVIVGVMVGVKVGFGVRVGVFVGNGVGVGEVNNCPQLLNKKAASTNKVREVRDFISFSFQAHFNFHFMSGILHHRLHANAIRAEEFRHSGRIGITRQPELQFPKPEQAEVRNCLPGRNQPLFRTEFTFGSGKSLNIDHGLLNI